MPLTLLASEPMDPELVRWAITSLAGAVGLLALARLKKAETSAEKCAKDLAEFKEAMTAKVHAVELDVAGLKGFATTAAEKIRNVEEKGLPREYFNVAQDSQNKVLNHVAEAVEDIKARLSEVERTKASRSDLRAARPYAPPLGAAAPIRRTDGPSEYPPEQPLPPMRAKLPSHQ